MNMAYFADPSNEASTKLDKETWTVKVGTKTSFFFWQQGWHRPVTALRSPPPWTLHSQEQGRQSTLNTNPDHEYIDARTIQQQPPLLPKSTFSSTASYDNYLAGYH